MASHYELKTFRNHAEEITHHQRMHKAYTDGKKAGAAGADTTACPYRTESDVGREWFAGYREGKNAS